MRRQVLSILVLVTLLTLLDQLYRWLHPEVNFARASLVGASAYAALFLLARLGLRLVPAVGGALAIAASAFGSVLLIEMGWIVSRSPTSVVVHVVLLAGAFLAMSGRTGQRGAANRAAP